MREAQECIARFSELEPCDFERVCEFAYSGDYTDPEATKIADNGIDIKEDFFVLSESIASREEEKKHAWLIARFLRNTFGSHRLAFYDANEDSLASGLMWLDRVANGWDDNEFDGIEGSKDSQIWKKNISMVLLGHARLYVFAKKYMIEKLQNLTLHKLHKFLTDLRIYRQACAPIFELVQYVYDDEIISDSGGYEPRDALRKLVIDFVILHRSALGFHSGHRAALRQDSEYAMDYTSVTTAMLVVLEYGNTMLAEPEEEEAESEAVW